MVNRPTLVAWAVACGLAWTHGVQATVPPGTEHLILCPAFLQQPFQDLADHRTQAGIPSAVVALEDALAVGPLGRDHAETLRNFIIELHSAGDLRFLLLGGDANLIPVRTVHSTFHPPGGSTDIATDLYFGGLDGDWDADGDGIFGEPFLSGAEAGDFADLDPEIAVGRAPVRSLTEARRFVDGVIAYDTLRPGVHHGSALLLAGAFSLSTWGLSYDGALLTEPVRDHLLDHPTPVMSSRLYENWTDYPGAAPLTASSALDALASAGFGIVYFVGEGGDQMLSMGTGPVGVADIGALMNAPAYFIFLALSNSAARFMGDGFLQRLVTAPKGGASMALGFTEFVFPNTALDYIEIFMGEVVADSGVLLGDAMVSALRSEAPDTFYNTSGRWTSLTLALLGDPAMPFRSELEPVPTRSISFGEFKAKF